MNKILKIGLIFNQKPDQADNESNSSVDMYAEWDGPETINAVASALKNGQNGTSGREIVLIEADNKMFDRLIKEKPDIVFNMAEGFNGASRESQVPAVLDMLNIPYTGSDPVTLGICLDKQRTKEILFFHNISTPKFLTLSSYKEFKNIFLPAVVKPVCEGSSKGIINNSLVRTQGELREQIERIVNDYSQPALVEEFIDGRELNVAVLGDKKPRVLPISEIDFTKMPDNLYNIVSYQAKWDPHHESYHKTIPKCPAKLSKKVEAKAKEIALSAFKIMSCRDYARIDMRLTKDDQLYVLEVNPNPDLTDGAGFMRSAGAAGYSYAQALKKITLLAWERRVNGR